MKNIIKAIANFQQECPIILKDTSGYGYKYADLTQIHSIINPLLQKHGLMYVQPINGSIITTRLYHIESGEMIESECSIPFDSIKYVERNGKTIIMGFEGMNTAQAYGSLITYFRRYTISSMLGLITDKDTDAAGLKPAQEVVVMKRLDDEFNLSKSEIEKMLSKATSVNTLTIIKDTFPQFAKYGPFKKLLTDKYNELIK